MNTKEKSLLTELIQSGGETVSECVTALGVLQYVDMLDFEQSVIDGLRVKLTEFLADGGSETHGPTFVSSRIEHASKEGAKNIHYLASFAGETICWEVAIDDGEPELEMSDAYVL